MKELLVAVLVIGIVALAAWLVGTGRKKRARGKNPADHKKTAASGSQGARKISDSTGSGHTEAAGSDSRADAGRRPSGSDGQPGSGSRSGSRGPAGANVQPGSGADSGLEGCYRAYLDLEAEKYRRQAAAVILTRQAGILERIQILLGFYQDISAGGNFNAAAGNPQSAGDHSHLSGGNSNAAAGNPQSAGSNSHSASSRSYVEGQLRAIEEDLERFQLAKGNPMGKEQYLRSLQLDPNDRARAGALLHQMEREKERLKQDEQYRYYLGILSALSSISWSLEAGQPALREQEDFQEAFAGLCRSLTETLSRAGVMFVGYEEAGEEKRKEWFRILDGARSYPCALKKEDKTLLVYGRAAKDREAGDNRKGRGGNRK